MKSNTGVRWTGRTASKRSRREAILHSVGTVLRDTGLSSLTMQDIALELGITKGNLYYYFKDKQDLLFQCHMQCMDLSLAALRELQSGEVASAEPLRTLLVRHITAMLDKGFGSVLLTDLDQLKPTQRRQYVARRDEFEAGVRQIIAAGVEQGRYECDDVKLAGLAMLGAINWVPKWYRPEGEWTAAEVATRLAGFLLKALAPAAAPKPRRGAKKA